MGKDSFKATCVLLGHYFCKEKVPGWLTNKDSDLTKNQHPMEVNHFILS